MKAFKQKDVMLPSPIQGGGRVTPAHTASHVVHAKLYRHDVGVLQPPLHLHHLLQEHVRGGGVALVHLNTTIASDYIY